MPERLDGRSRRQIHRKRIVIHVLQGVLAAGLPWGCGRLGYEATSEALAVSPSPDTASSRRADGAPDSGPVPRLDSGVPIRDASTQAEDARTQDASSQARDASDGGVVHGASGGVLREYWLNIGGNFITDGTTDPRYPDEPTGADQLSSLRAVSWDDPSVTQDWGESYLQRIRGFIRPEETGEYTFWIISDNSSEFYLGTDPSPESAQLTAAVEGQGFTGLTEFDRYESQQSSPRMLQKGQLYYLEILHKEGVHEDHLMVYWNTPGQSPDSSTAEIVPGRVLVMPEGTQ